MVVLQQAKQPRWSSSNRDTINGFYTGLSRFWMKMFLLCVHIFEKSHVCGRDATAVRVSKSNEYVANLSYIKSGKYCISAINSSKMISRVKFRSFN